MTDKNIKAMVLAAGVGSRLNPLTDLVPKPIVKIAGRTIMDYILLHLKKHGITNVISNTHHLAENIHQHFKDAKEKLGVDIQFLYEEKLTGVAGGIRRCKEFLQDSTACIIMGDALTNIDLSDLYQKHQEAVEKFDCLATVAQMQVEDTTQFGVIVTDSLLPNGKQGLEANRIIKFQEKPKKEDALSNWANTGIYFFEPRIFDYIPSENEAPVYDVAKDLFPRLLEAGEYIQAIAVDPNTYWADLGTPQQYLDTLAELKNGKVEMELAPFINPEAQIDASAVLEGANEIGVATIKAGARIKNSIIWDGVVIEENVHVEDSIIGPNCVIKASEAVKQKVLAEEANNHINA